MRVLGILLLGILAAGCASSPRAAVDSPQSMFIVRQTEKTPDDVVAAVKAYAEARKWPYLGVDKVKQGQVLLVKVCVFPRSGSKFGLSGCI